MMKSKLSTKALLELKLGSSVEESLPKKKKKEKDKRNKKSSEGCQIKRRKAKKKKQKERCFRG